MVESLANDLSETQSLNDNSFQALEEELPLPEEDESLVDLKYIYWGYLNCCPIAVNGKKVRKEKWFTYWIDLCGSTLRFYKDETLLPDSALQSPPVSCAGYINESASKVAVFELGGSLITILKDGAGFKNRGTITSKSRYAKIYRRHICRIKFMKTSSVYIFQAPTQSALLVWVSKIQECIDAISNNKMSFLAEERLKLARYMMKKDKLINAERDTLDGTSEADSIDFISEVDSLDITSEDSVDVITSKSPRYSELKSLLSEKQELLWQLEQQFINFLGNKGSFKRNEFICTTKQDYYLISSRMETFLPCGTKVNVFGQLPNGRWRCLIEMNDLIEKMNELVTSLQSVNNNADVNISKENDDACFELKNNNIPDYPLIGSIPTSIINFPTGDEHCRCSGGSTSPVCRCSATPVPQDESDCVTPCDAVCLDDQIPYSGHKKRKRSTPMKAWTTSSPVKTLNNTELVGDSSLPLPPDDFLESDLDDNDLEDDGTMEEEQVYGASSLPAQDDSGIVIRKKLRPRGISILVGSSSSEDEENDGDEVFPTQCVYTSK